MRAAVGILFAAAIAFAAWRTRALSMSGALAAMCVGVAVFVAGGLPYAAVLFAFFIPSTLLSELGRSRKRELVDAGKAGPRNGFQVAANGGIAALCAILAALTHSAWAAGAFAGAFAAASADTWGTEIGTLAAGVPRSIITWRPVVRGFSGGVTLTGTLAEIGGALAVAATAGALGIAAWWMVAAAGFCGALIDSVLGATAQAVRYCDRCGRTCEMNPHVCGAPGRHIRGAAWLDNDGVNACATLAGALIAGGLTALL